MFGKLWSLQDIWSVHLPSEDRNLSGLKTWGSLKCVGSFMMKLRLAKNMELVGKVKVSAVVGAVVSVWF